MKAKRVKRYGERDKECVCYWKVSDGSWLIYLPDTRIEHFDGLLGGLKNHTVEEHEDGTITVSPSILIQSGGITRHGFLCRGIWTECLDSLK